MDASRRLPSCDPDATRRVEFDTSDFGCQLHRLEAGFVARDGVKLRLVAVVQAVLQAVQVRLEGNWLSNTEEESLAPGFVRKLCHRVLAVGYLPVVASMPSWPARVNAVDDRPVR